MSRISKPPCICKCSKISILESLERQARAKEVQAEAARAVDAAANQVELSKMIQDMNEREALLEEELSTLRKNRDSRIAALAKMHDEVICLEPALQAANGDCDVIDQELQLVGQNAPGDRDVVALRDLATKEVISEIEESVGDLLEPDWLAAILAL